MRQRTRFADNSWQNTAMGNEGGIPKDKRKSNMLLSAVLGVAGLALGWAALEIGMGSIQNPERENIDRSRKPKVYEVVDEEPGVVFVQERRQKDDNQDKEVESHKQREDIEAWTTVPATSSGMSTIAVNDFAREELQLRTIGD